MWIVGWTVGDKRGSTEQKQMAPTSGEQQTQAGVRSVAGKNYLVQCTWYDWQCTGHMVGLEELYLVQCMVWREMRRVHGAWSTVGSKEELSLVQ